MQIQFNTGVCTLLLVKVPKGTNHRILDFSSRKDIPMQILVVTVQDYRWHHDLTGKWQFIGLSHELTEEQCADILPSYSEPKQMDYMTFDSNKFCETAKESFASLCRHLKVYNVNPYGETEPSDIPDLGAFTQSRRELWRKWKNAQETVGRWAVLRLEDRNV